MSKFYFNVIYFLMLFLFYSTSCSAQNLSEREVSDLIDTSQSYFKKKDLDQILNLMTFDFTYEVTTFVDGEIYKDKMNLFTYANHLRMFFNSNPEIREDSAEIQNINVLDGKATTELVTNSHIFIGEESQKCSGTVFYEIVKRDKRILISGMRGENKCEMLGIK